MKKWDGQKKGEQGMAAIFVVMTLMTLLALISIGFSRLMNREVRQSLDRQLSTAAYFAAESGVNDTRNYLDSAAGSTQIKGCATPTGDPSFVTNGDISGDGLFKYSCVIVNPTPKELSFDIPAGQSKVVKLSGASLSAMSKLYFGWQNTDSQNPQPLGAYGTLPQQSGVGAGTGLLRVGLYPMVSGCTNSDGRHGSRQAFYAQALTTNTADAAIECASRNYFMYPSAGPGTAPDCAYGALASSNGCVRYIENNNVTVNNDGGIVPGNCNATLQAPNTSFKSQAHSTYCNSVISNLMPVAGAAGTNQPASYYLRLTAVYHDITVYIQASDNASPTPNSLTIANAEAVVDVTGTGNDILRRIQTRAPLQDITPPLNYGLQSMESVCKLFRSYVTGPGQYGYSQVDAGGFNIQSNTYGDDCTAPTGGNSIDPNGLPSLNLTPPPTVTLIASPGTVSPGSGTTLSWTSTNATTCSASGGPWSGTFGPSGSAGTGGIGSSTTFSILCTGPSGQKSDSVTVNVVAAPSGFISYAGNGGTPNTYWNFACWQGQPAVITINPNMTGGSQATVNTGTPSGSSYGIGGPYSAGTPISISINCGGVNVDSTSITF